jgi:hypothetical protein
MTEQEAINAVTAFIAANSDAHGADVARDAASVLGRSIADRKDAAKRAIKTIG